MHTSPTEAPARAYKADMPEGYFRQLRAVRDDDRARLKKIIADRALLNEAARFLASKISQTRSRLGPHDTE